MYIPYGGMEKFKVFLSKHRLTIAILSSRIISIHYAPDALMRIGEKIIRRKLD